MGAAEKLDPESKMRCSGSFDLRAHRHCDYRSPVFSGTDNPSSAIHGQRSIAGIVKEKNLMTAGSCGVIALIMFIGFFIIRVLYLYGVDKKDRLVLKVVLEKLILNPRIRRESLIEIVEDQLKIDNPKMEIDWRNEINNKIDLLKEKKCVSERGDFLFFHRPVGG